MDRSFLADKDVIAASRKFVCIRLATYENAEENEVLKGFYARGGNLENTVFTLLTPDGKTKLVTAGRSPAWAFGGVSGRGINAQPEEPIKKMGQTMEAIALAYPGKGKAAKGFPPLPYLADLRLALNVTAADRQPLVVVYSKSVEQRKKMEEELSKVAWSDQFIGEAQYVAASDASEFKTIKNFRATSGFVVVQPGTFGLTGEVIDVIEFGGHLASEEPACTSRRHSPSLDVFRVGPHEVAEWAFVRDFHSSVDQSDLIDSFDFW